MQIRRIAIITVHTGPLAAFGGQKTGGMNVYIRELAEELGRRGIGVDVFTRRSSAAEPEIDSSIPGDVRVIYLPAGPLKPLPPEELFPYLSQFTAGLMAFATRHIARYDIVYSHYWLSGWVAYKLKEAWGIPFVHMFHTLGQMKKRVLSSGMVVPDERIAVETQITQWADRIIAATPAEYSQLVWLYRARRRKIVIVPPGVNMERFRPEKRAAARARLGLDEDCKLLLFVGRLEPLKAVDTILQALSLLRERRPDLLKDLCFAIIGGDLEDNEDAELARLRDLCAALNLDGVACFMGARDRTALPHYYTAATAVIMPSDYESFGLVALEAMASGTPVIASQTGGLAFLVRDNETGFLVPVRQPELLAERIETLLSDQKRGCEMGRMAAMLAHKYAWPLIADQLVDIFNGVLFSAAKQTRRSDTSPSEDPSSKQSRSGV